MTYERISVDNRLPSPRYLTLGNMWSSALGAVRRGIVWEDIFCDFTGNLLWLVCFALCYVGLYLGENSVSILLWCGGMGMGMVARIVK